MIQYPALGNVMGDWLAMSHPAVLSSQEYPRLTVRHLPSKVFTSRQVPCPSAASMWTDSARPSAAIAFDRIKSFEGQSESHDRETFSGRSYTSLTI